MAWIRRSFGARDRAKAPELVMSGVSRRFVLTGAALTTASLLVPLSVRPPRAQGRDEYEITDWIMIAASDRTVWIGAAA